MSLLLSYAPSPGTCIELALKNGSSCTIGRSPSCDLVLKQKNVSGNHALLLYSHPDQWFLEDLNSNNGTFLDGVKISKKVLIEKPSTIRLGSSGPIIRVQPNHEGGNQVAISKNRDVRVGALKSNSLSLSPTHTNSQPVKKIRKGLLELGSIAGFFLVSSIAIYGVGRLSSTLFSSSTNTSKTKDLPSEEDSSQNIDAATQIAGQINFFADPTHPGLNDEQQYRKGIGDMARVQVSRMIKKDQARNFPTIVIGRQGLKKCDDTPNSAGTYNPKCQELLVAFDTYLRYDYPIEVLYVLAHEYAHHLVEISLGSTSVSGLDNELTADCFAGYMAGYWNSQGKLTLEELNQGFIVMQAVAKVESSDSTDTHGDEGQRKGAFFAGYERAGGKVVQQYQNFCKTLDRILKL